MRVRPDPLAWRSSLRTLAALPRCSALANHPELAKVRAQIQKGSGYYLVV